MSLLRFENLFSNLKLNTRGGGEKSPHKVAMLLAVIDLIESGTITENHIAFDQALKTTFTHHFLHFAGPSDRDNPHLPFFHLRSSGFWHHHLKPGKTDDYRTLTTASGPGTIVEHIAFAYLDDELFELLANGVARELLKTSLLKNLTVQDRDQLLGVGEGWNWLECEATVQDYFLMLKNELAGQKYNKTEHRRALASKLRTRSKGSIEYKHQNISAVLVELGQPYIQGYKPAFNYQQQLKQVVLAHLAANPSDIESMIYAADAVTLKVPTQIDWDRVFDPELPERIPSVQESKRQYLARNTNFTDRERNNRQLGQCGESFVVEFERYRLKQLGRADLANEVEWSSRVRGDGLGYDVTSFNHERDEELYIEVKTTSSGKYQPFFVSKNELAFSKTRPDHYSLYRVYNFKQNARIYQLSGPVDKYVNLDPQNYLASFS
ncbi:DUF3883 domain-containing protein [Pseudomaricurvus alcaniphilus]|uniref:DUF3883 domain-containing protein n=1 Tax=Pseudomaricurvus alcaniphilus TaxID=1166482 RepID=UPI001409D76F|nr:DUF3883 domain-containing protein [Pseudomaricurvus alcaniphilus]NHN35736.1 DUF3883 domain-containing protein [Pseudomaricurvus alcaniphilus]